MIGDVARGNVLRGVVGVNRAGDDFGAVREVRRRERDWGGTHLGAGRAHHKA